MKPSQEVAVFHRFRNRIRGAVLGLAMLALAACEGGGPIGPAEEPVAGAGEELRLPGLPLPPIGGGGDIQLVQVRRGQTLTNRDGRLLVPVGALLEDILITQEPMDDGTLGFLFGPEGLVFLKPAILTISVGKADLRGVNPWRLRIAVASDDSDDWQVVGGIYNPLTRTVTVPVLHFSRYALCIL